MQFGIYLKNRGVISAEQLVAALEVQLRTLVPIGQLALEEGLISARDIFAILRAQSESPHERFGELAVEMRLITRDELMRLLMIQADRKRSLAEILVWQGVLTRSQMERELGAFRSQQANPRTTVTKVCSLRPRMELARQSAVPTTAI
jgi:hypothetical protein